VPSFTHHHLIAAYKLLGNNHYCCWTVMSITEVCVWHHAVHPIHLLT